MNELLKQIAAEFNKRPNRDDALRESLVLALAHFHSETGTIHLLDAPKQELRLVAHVGLPPAMLDVVRLIPVGKGIAGQTVVRDGPVSICNIQSDKSGMTRPGAKQSGVGGALCVPLRADGVILGTVGIGTVREHEYTPDETKALEEIAQLLGTQLNKK